MQGGKFKIEVAWDCNFDWGNDIFDCLPTFNFINRKHDHGKPQILWVKSTWIFYCNFRGIFQARSILFVLCPYYP
jgi:hypothetical protein